MDGNPADSSGNEAKLGRFSRRSVIRFGSLAGVAAFGGVGALALSTGGARAQVSGADLVANSAEVSTDDGTVTDVDLHDSDEGDNAGIDFTWEGFDQGTVTVTYTLKAGLTGNGNGDGTENAVAPAQMLSGSSDVTETSGSVSLDWATALGASTVSLLKHTNIDTAAFEAAEDGGQRVRELEVTLTADASHDDVTVTDTQTATALLTTGNIAGSGTTGGTVNATMS